MTGVQTCALPIFSFAAGTTVLLATHQAGLAAHLKRRTLTLEGGRLVKDEG